jgi:hypothetical protein
VYLLSNVRWKIIQALHGRYHRGGYFGNTPVFIQEPKKAGTPITILWWDHSQHWNACSVNQPGAASAASDPSQGLGLPVFLARGCVQEPHDLFQLQMVEWHVPFMATEALGCMVIVSGDDYLNTHIQIQLQQVASLRADLAQQLQTSAARLASEVQKYHNFAAHYCYSETEDDGKLMWLDHNWLAQAKGKKGADHTAAQVAGYSKGHAAGKADGKGQDGNSRYRAGWDQGYGKGWTKGHSDGLAEGYQAGKARGKAGGKGVGAQEAGEGKGKGPYVPIWTSKHGWCNKMVNLLGNIRLERWREVNRLVEVCLGCKFDIIGMLVYV